MILGCTFIIILLCRVTACPASIITGLNVPQVVNRLYRLQFQNKKVVIIRTLWNVSKGISKNSEEMATFKASIGSLTIYPH